MSFDHNRVLLFGLHENHLRLLFLDLSIRVNTGDPGPDPDPDSGPDHDPGLGPDPDCSEHQRKNLNM